MGVWLVEVQAKINREMEAQATIHQVHNHHQLEISFLTKIACHKLHTFQQIVHLGIYLMVKDSSANFKITFPWHRE